MVFYGTRSSNAQPFPFNQWVQGVQGNIDEFFALRGDLVVAKLVGELCSQGGSLASVTMGDVAHLEDYFRLIALTLKATK